MLTCNVTLPLSQIECQLTHTKCTKDQQDFIVINQVNNNKRLPFVFDKVTVISKVKKEKGAKYLRVSYLIRFIILLE